MTMPPPPGAPFPTGGGFSIDPTRDPTDPWTRSMRERMFEERVVIVSGKLDDLAGTEATMQLMALDASGDGPVTLRLDCSESCLEPAFSLVDVIDLLGVDVHVVCSGQVVGPAVAVVSVGHLRRALPHTRFRLVEPRLAFSGHPRDIEAMVSHQRDQLKRLCERVARATGQTTTRVEQDMRSGLYMGAEEAKEYGLIDEVVQPEAKVLEFPRRLGFRPR